MNCRSARQLISPYLDGQLTGREMLALGDHLAECESCHREMDSLKQVKVLLRGLAVPRPPLDFSRQLSSQEIYSQSAPWRAVSLPPRPQRGRRLLAALALSCLTLFALVPASQDGQTVSPAVPLSAFPASAAAVPPRPLLLPPSDSALGPSAFALGGASRPGLVTFAGETTFEGSMIYPPSYASPSVTFQTNHPSSTPILTGYRRR